MAVVMSLQNPYAINLAKASYAMPETPTTSKTYTLKPLTLPSQSFQRKKYKTPLQPAPTPIHRRSKEGTSSWREIHGANNWENLLDPLNPLLKDEIVRYGEFISACYKAFDLDKGSKHYLHCKYGRKNMLREVGLGGCGYEVTKYIYAAPSFRFPIDSEMCCSRWLGYVAVSSDDQAKKLGRRDVMVVFRGTVTNPEWMANFMSSLTPAKLDPLQDRPDVKVESGFLSLYTSEDSSHKFGISSCREQVLSELSRIVNEYKGEEMSISIAGHSMGSSIGLLLAYDIAELGLNRTGSVASVASIPITVFSYGGPRVGNSGFRDRCEELGVKVLRVANVNDPITRLPGVIFNENFNVFGGKYELPWKSSCYTHVGVELALDFFHLQNPSSVHDLDTYISLLKCPRRIQVQKTGPTVIDRARKSLLCSMKSLNAWQWNYPNLLRNAGTMLRVL